MNQMITSTGMGERRTSVRLRKGNAAMLSVLGQGDVWKGQDGVEIGGDLPLYPKKVTTK